MLSWSLLNESAPSLSFRFAQRVDALPTKHELYVQYAIRILTESILEALEVVAVLGDVGSKGIRVEDPSLQGQHEGMAERAQGEILVLGPQRPRDGVHSHLLWELNGDVLCSPGMQAEEASTSTAILRRWTASLPGFGSSAADERYSRCYP